MTMTKRPTKPGFFSFIAQLWALYWERMNNLATESRERESCRHACAMNSAMRDAVEGRVAP